MDKYGAGAEKYARFKQYDYKANSNMVLTSDAKRVGHEPTGEPESLAGRMMKMGDRVAYQKPEGMDDRKERLKKKRKEQADIHVAGGATKKRTGASVLDLDTAGFYRPRTKETRAAYEALLNTIHQQFGDQPQDVLRGAADEVLAVLKNDNMTDPARHKEISELLGPTTDDRFAELKAIERLITDYTAEADAAAAGAGETMDEEIGVAVEFEDEEEAEDSEVDEVVDSEGGDEDSEGVEAAAHELGTTMDVDAGEEAEDDGSLSVQERRV